jgi:hypothetical protein
MDLELEGLETIADGLFVKPVSELLALAAQMIEAARPPSSMTADDDEVLRRLENQFFAEEPRAPEVAAPVAAPIVATLVSPLVAPLVAPPIPGPPLGDIRHLFRPPLARTMRTRPLRIAL